MMQLKFEGIMIGQNVMKDIKCGICQGSSKVKKVYYTVSPGEAMKMIDTGK